MATVDRFHQAGLRAGGADDGAPAERPCQPGDEAVHHAPATRSAESVRITF